MNKAEKNVQQTMLNDEKRMLTDIQSTYEDALQEINYKISALMGRNDADLPNVIYRIQYQQQLKKQIEDVLQGFADHEYNTISEYLESCYQNGFIGTMYDLNYQGIPLILPINQDQVAQAIMYESRLAGTLQSRLYDDVKWMARVSVMEISRGIASGQSYDVIAQNITDITNVTKSKAMRIAKTEGHRVNCKAAYDAQVGAKAKGCDIVKQWDSALDGKTRYTHRMLDGQLREVDELFESSSGLKARFPGDFGNPAEDCNCRCAILQRAKWALDADELKTLQERASYYGLDKTESFEEYKRKYLEAQNDPQKTEAMNKQIALLKKYGGEARIYLFGSAEDVQEWGSAKSITGKTEQELKTEMLQNPNHWESLLEMQTEAMFERYTDKLLDVATDAELSALNLWSSATYSLINRYWRTKTEVGEIATNAALKIESVLKKTIIDETIIVRRGTGVRTMFQNIVGDWENDASVLVGQDFPDYGFTATSPFVYGGFGGTGKNNAELFIKIPAGTHGAYMAMESHAEAEKELLLQKGYRYRIIKAEYRQNPLYPEDRDLKIWCEVELNEQI